MTKAKKTKKIKKIKKKLPASVGPSLLSKLIKAEVAAKRAAQEEVVEKEVQALQKKERDFSGALQGIWPHRKAAPVIDGDALRAVWEIFWDGSGDDDPFEPGESVGLVCREGYSREASLTIRRDSLGSDSMEQLVQGVNPRYTVTLQFTQGWSGGSGGSPWMERINSLKRATEQHPTMWFGGMIRGVPEGTKDPWGKQLEPRERVACHKELSELLLEASQALREWVAPQRAKLIADLEQTIAQTEATIEDHEKQREILLASAKKA